MNYPHNDKIKAILNDKADFVFREGLNYLIPAWQRFADCYVENEELIYEWQNDLDTRNIIDEILPVLAENERIKIEEVLKPIDEKVMAKTFEINECIYSKEIEKKYKYNRHKNWYYYRLNQKIFENEKGVYTEKV